MHSDDTDVLIVGAGVIGLCSAWYLLQSGRSVRLLDQARPGAGASHGNCGTITPSHAPPLAAPGVPLQALRWMLHGDSPLYIRPRLDPRLWAWLLRFAGRCRSDAAWWQSARGKAALLRASRAELPRLLEAATIECEFVASGLLYAYRDAASFERQWQQQAYLPDLGIAVERWDAARTAAAEPALKPGVVGGIYFPDDAVLRPDRYVAGLAAAVQRAGAEVIAQARVTAIEADQARVRLDDGRRFGGRQLLLATGAWSPKLASNLGLALPIQPGKGYSITYTAPGLAPRRPLVLRERSVCVTAWGSGFRLGSTMEFAGYDDCLNRTRLDALVRAARDYLVEPEGPQRLEEWFGWRPMVYDDLPIIGAAPRHPNCFLAAGHGMLGVSMSAATGQLVATLMSGAAPMLDPSPYSPQRFAH